MLLSPHFDLSEMVRTSTGLPNEPDQRAVAYLTRLANELLEPVREALGGCPLRVLSGYRSEEVNDAVGGAPLSQHRWGCASDVVPVGVDLQVAMRTIWDLNRARKLFPNQAIIYPLSGFLHLSIEPNNMIPKGQFLVSQAPRGSRGPYVAWLPGS